MSRRWSNGPEREWADRLLDIQAATNEADEGYRGLVAQLTAPGVVDDPDELALIWSIARGLEDVRTKQRALQRIRESRLADVEGRLVVLTAVQAALKTA